MKVKITQVGQPKDIDTQYGKKTKISIKTNEHGDKWLSAFANKDNQNLKVGTEIDIDIEQRGQYLNFKLKEDKVTQAQLRESLEPICQYIRELRNRIADLKDTFQEFGAQMENLKKTLGVDEVEQLLGKTANENNDQPAETDPDEEPLPF